MKRTFCLVMALAFLFAGGMISSPDPDATVTLQPFSTWELGGSQNGANVYCKFDACNGDLEFMFFKVENTTASPQTVVFHCNITEPGKTPSTYNNITVTVAGNSATEGTCVDMVNGELNIAKLLQDQYTSPTVSITF